MIQIVARTGSKTLISFRMRILETCHRYWKKHLFKLIMILKTIHLIANFQEPHAQSYWQGDLSSYRLMLVTLGPLLLIKMAKHDPFLETTNPIHQTSMPESWPEEVAFVHSSISKLVLRWVLPVSGSRSLKSLASPWVAALVIKSLRV